MKSGRHPQPTQLRLARGNPGKRPVSKDEPKFAHEMPDCPPHLDEIARNEWKRVSVDLFGAKLLTKADRAALAAYCDCYSLWARASEEMKTQTLVISSPNGAGMQNPLVGIINQAKLGMLKFLTEFGMSPSSRTRVHAEKETESDPFEAFMGKKRA